jgi:hypothetical protein
MEQKPFNNPGPLICARDIAERYLANTRTPRWVLKNVCPEKRIDFSSATIRWFEAHVVEWLQTRPRKPAKRGR